MKPVFEFVFSTQKDYEQGQDILCSSHDYQRHLVEHNCKVLPLDPTRLFGFGKCG
jgi:hypothetical protein